MREIIHVEQNAKYVAIDHPGAIIFDHRAQLIWIGLDRVSVQFNANWKCLLKLIEHRDEIVPYQLLPGSRLKASLERSYLADLIGRIAPMAAFMGMVIETIDGAGFRLHTNPRETLECCQNLVAGQPLPTRVRSMHGGRGRQHTKPAPLFRASTRATRELSKRRTL